MMETKDVEQTTEKVHFLDFWKKNIVFVSAMGLVPIVAGATSLKAAMAYALLFLVLMVGTYAVAAILPLDFSSAYRIPIYAGVAALLFIPTWFLLSVLFPTFRDMMSIYLYAAVMEMMVIYKADQFARKTTLGNAIFGAIVNWLGFAIVILLCGTIREFLAYGTIWGNTLHEFKISGASRPFFGFILVGFLGAGYTAIRDAIERPKHRAPRKGHQKHKTLSEEILENQEKENKQELETTEEQEIPAAFRQAHAEARQQKKIQNKEKKGKNSAENEEKPVDPEINIQTIEVVVPLIEEGDGAFKIEESKVNENPSNDEIVTEITEVEETKSKNDDNENE